MVGWDWASLLEMICFQALGKAPEVLGPTEVTVTALYSYSDETLAASYRVWFQNCAIYYFCWIGL